MYYVNGIICCTETCHFVSLSIMFVKFIWVNMGDSIFTVMCPPYVNTVQIIYPFCLGHHLGCFQFLTFQTQLPPVLLYTPFCVHTEKLF